MSKFEFCIPTTGKAVPSTATAGACGETEIAFG
jgi:hypothetical protein